MWPSSTLLLVSWTQSLNSHSEYKLHHIFLSPAVNQWIDKRVNQRLSSRVCWWSKRHIFFKSSTEFLRSYFTRFRSNILHLALAVNLSDSRCWIFHKLINYIILKTHNNANKIEFYCIPQRSWGPRIFAIYDYSLTECTAWVLILNTNFLISFCLQQYISGLTNEFIMANVCIKASLIMQTS